MSGAAEFLPLYLKEKKKTLLLLLALLLLIFGVFAAVSREKGPLLYTLLLSLVLLSVAALFDFASYAKRIEQLQALLREEELLVSLLSKHQAQTPSEELCLALVQKSLRREEQTKERLMKDLSRLKEDYTLWTHEIKTPLSALKLLINQSEIEEKPLLQGEIFRIEEYLDNLLAYIRLNAAGTDYLFARFPLDELLRRSVRKYAPVFIRKKLELHFHPTNFEVLTDEKWFCFLLDQLLSNALKYTLEGGITLQWEEDALLLSDTGIGILPEDLPRIWEMGYTGQNGRQAERSTGMGLSLCRSIAEQLSLGLSLHSVPGKGTQIRISFPSKNLSKMSQ